MSGAVVSVTGRNKDRSSAEVEAQELSTAAADRQRASLGQVRASRDALQVRRTLARVSEAARGDENLMPAIREAVLAYATVGEITAALKQVFGEYHPPSRF